MSTKKIEEDFGYLKEMANVIFKYSGLEKGIVQIRPEEKHKYFPHIHYIENIKEENYKFIKFSISDDINKIRIIEQKNLVISSKQKKAIFKFIVKNAIVLTKYYNREDVDTIGMLNSIQEI